MFVFGLLFYFIYCRILTLTNMISNCTIDVEFCRNAYQKLSDVTDKGKTNFSCMYFWCLAFYVSDIMLAILYPLTKINSEKSLLDFISANITLLPSFFIITAPIITASRLASQVDTLRLMLYDRLIQDRDKDHYVVLQKLIRYIEARTFEFKIAGIIPLDWSLVAIVTNIMVTYIIVLLQLTPKIAAITE